MIPVALPQDINDILPTLQEIIRRASDGTTPVIFVANITIQGSGNGIILPADNSSNSYLLTVTDITNDDGSIAPTLQLTRQ